MISSQRQHLILSRLRTRGAVRITALSKELGVSAMTIRRDIADLSDKGLLKRVHGGAVSTSALLSEPLFSVKSQMDIGLKDAIAREAVQYVAPGDVTHEMRRRAKAELPPRVAYYSQILGVAPTGIKITSAKKRFGSCNGKNSICFSLYLMQYPQAAIDYVVVHELCHIRHHDHSPAFYRLVESVLPDYKERERLLRR